MPFHESTQYERYNQTLIFFQFGFAVAEMFKFEYCIQGLTPCRHLFEQYQTLWKFIQRVSNPAEIYLEGLIPCGNQLRGIRYPTIFGLEGYDIPLRYNLLALSYLKAQCRCLCPCSCPFPYPSPFCVPVSMSMSKSTDMNRDRERTEQGQGHGQGHLQRQGQGLGQGQKQGHGHGLGQRQGN